MSAPATFEARLDRVVGSRQGTELILIGLDHRGQPIATIALSPSVGGGATIAADYDDGFVEVEVSGRGWMHTASTLPNRVAARRAELMAGKFVQAAEADHRAEAGVVTCAIKAAGAVVACSPPYGALAIVSCPGLALLAICDCGQAAGLEPNEGSCPE